MKVKLKVKYYVSDLIAILIFILTLVEMFSFIGFGSFLGYLDEVVALTCILKICLTLYEGRYSKSDYYIIFFSILLLIVGICGNIIFKYRTNILLIFLDIIATYKGILYYLAFKSIKLNSLQIQSIVKLTCNLFFILIILMFPFSLLNLFVDVGMGSEIVYGLRSFRFVFGGPGNCSLIFYVILTSILTKISIQNNIYIYDKIYLGLSLFVCISTLRSRMIAFVIIFFLLYFIMFIMNKRTNFRIKLWHILFALVLIYAIGHDKINFYFNNSNTARYNLLYYGIVTLLKCFPIGSGFATYGSSIAADYYSPLYIEYGFPYIYGLGPGNGTFSNDGLWGEILGQFGFIGTIAFCLIFIVLFLSLLKKAINKYDKFLYIYVVLILFLGSIGTKTVMHFVIIPVFILLGIKSRLLQFKSKIVNKNRYSFEKLDYERDYKI